MVYRYEGQEVTNQRIIEQLGKQEMKVGSTYSVFPNKNLVVVVHMRVERITGDIVDLVSQGNWRKFKEEWSI